MFTQSIARIDAQRAIASHAKLVRLKDKGEVDLVQWFKLAFDDEGKCFVILRDGCPEDKQLWLMGFFANA